MYFASPHRETITDSKSYSGIDMMRFEFFGDFSTDLTPSCPVCRRIRKTVCMYTGPAAVELGLLSEILECGTYSECLCCHHLILVSPIFPVCAATLLFCGVVGKCWEEHGKATVEYWATWRWKSRRRTQTAPETLFLSSGRKIRLSKILLLGRGNAGEDVKYSTKWVGRSARCGRSGQQ